MVLHIEGHSAGQDAEVLNTVATLALTASSIYWSGFNRQRYRSMSTSRAPSCCGVFLVEDRARSLAYKKLGNPAICSLDTMILLLLISYSGVDTLIP